MSNFHVESIRLVIIRLYSPYHAGYVRPARLLAYGGQLGRVRRPYTQLRVDQQPVGLLAFPKREEGADIGRTR